MKKIIFTLSLFFVCSFSQAQIVPIASITINDSQGLPVEIGAFKTVSGIVTVGNEFGGPSYLQDATGGIAVFYQELSAAASIGDSVVVTAQLGHFNGLTELVYSTNGGTPSFTIVSAGHPVPAPIVITLQQFNSQTWNGHEEYEGSLIRINGLTTTASGTFQGNTNYSVTDPSATGLFMRIDNNSNLVGTLIPTGAFDCIGAASQFKSSAPFNSGYQFFPRFTSDIIQTVGPVILIPPAESNINPTSVTLSWTTQNPGDSKLKYFRSDSLSQPIVFSDSLYSATPTTNHSFTLSGLLAGRIYYALASSTNASGTSVSTPKYFSTSSDPTSTGKFEIYFNRSVDHSYAMPGNNARGDADLKVRLGQRIDSATKSIDIAMYSFNEINQLRDKLINALIRGVKIRMVYDSRPTQELVQELINAGIRVQKRPVDQNIMHNKFFIFDARDNISYSDDWIWGGSANITDEQFYTDVQNVIIIQDQALCNTYTREFEEMWGSHNEINNPSFAKFGAAKSDNTPHIFNINGKRVNCYFSPTDNVSTQIEDMITSQTNKSILFCAFAFTRFNIANKMKTQYQPPDKMVRGVFDNGNATDPSSVYPEMKGIGGLFPWNPPAPVYLETQTGTMHSKYILIDADMPGSNPIVETGSFNYSTAATVGNDENVLMIYDSLIANQYYQEFVRRYAEAGGQLNVEQISAVVPDNYTLSQNYPNPFNPNTIINYSIPKSGNVSLKIFDVLGREVFNLVNVYQTTGTYKVTFDGSNLSSGIYFYNLVSGSFADTKRMILVK